MARQQPCPSFPATDTRDRVKRDYQETLGPPQYHRSPQRDRIRGACCRTLVLDEIHHTQAIAVLKRKPTWTEKHHLVTRRRHSLPAPDGLTTCDIHHHQTPGCWIAPTVTPGSCPEVRSWRLYLPGNHERKTPAVPGGSLSIPPPCRVGQTLHH